MVTGGVLQSTMLAMALTVDSFAAGVGLGVQRIRVPLFSSAVASGVGALWLAAGGWIGQSARQFFPAQVARIGAALLMIAIGGFKLFEETIKLLLRRHGQKGKVGFSAFGLHFLLEVYLAPERADANRSKTLGGFEAVGLGLVLSADNLSAGVGAGMEGLPLFFVLILVAVLGAAFLFLGSLAACSASREKGRDLSLIGGMVLIGLGVLRLLG